MNNRNFMKSYFGNHKGIITDQMKGMPYPPLQKPFDKKGAEIVHLPEFDKSIIKKNDIFECIKDRRSIRKFTNEFLTKEELSFLLWATQGVGEIIRDGYATLRTVPSAGARHPFETYIIADRVKGIDRGVYRYLALKHQLLFLFTQADIPEKLTGANLGQKFVGDAPLVFVWSCIPYRTEWRYSFKAHKVILLDAGHVCQNLYLAAESIGCGTCAIGAYAQKAMDDLLGLDGNDEFVVYLAPVGKFRH